ncbi:MAG: hypothetical protein K9K67_15995 [Bacteriovoracaceae bacterium]|nr:hypothetical protein [Bacteriovoracaceae bacterium]
MKRKNFFTLLMIGLLTFGLSSCGDDNEKGGPLPVTSGTASNPFNDNGYVNNTCQSATSFEDFKNKVSAGSFVTELNNYETYYFVEQEPETDQGKFLGFIPYNTFKWVTLGQFTRSSTKGTSEVNHEAGSEKVVVRDYLMAILNQKSQHRGGGSYYEVLTYSGEVFGINLCLPIAANPVYRANSQTGRRYFYTGTGSSQSNGYFGFTTF